MVGYAHVYAKSCLLTKELSNESHTVSSYASVQFKLYMCVPAHLLCVKLKSLAYTCTVACKFCMHMPASEHMQRMSDAHYELALGLPECMCDQCTGTVATYKQ